MVVKGHLRACRHSLEVTGMPQNRPSPVGWTGAQDGLGIPAVRDTSLGFGSGEFWV